MHELSLAEAVVDIASRHAAGRRVTVVEVRVGHLRQVVPDSLRFAFELLCDGTTLQGARLVIDEVPARGRCRACGAETTMAGFPLACAECGAYDVEIVAGEELLVAALEIEEPMTTLGADHGR